MTTDGDHPSTAPAAMRLVVDATLSELSVLRSKVRHFVQSFGASELMVDDLALAVSELATNVIEHTDSASISLSMARHDDTWTIDMADADAIPALDEVSMPEVTRPTGRGLAVVQAIMDSVAIDDVDGTTVIHCIRYAG